MSEVVTFQLGSFSNFVGSHFWNIEQEQTDLDSAVLEKQQRGEDVLTSGIRSSALFSEHEVGRHTIYRPRLVAADLQGALGGFHSAEVKDEPVCWDGPVASFDPHGYATLSKHPYIRYLNSELPIELAHAAAQEQKDGDLLNDRKFNFSSTVRWFSDYLSIDWEPFRHMAFVPEQFYGITAFDSFCAGRALTRCEEPGSFWDHLTDLFRVQLELSDQLGVVHILLDWETGFGGIGAGAVEWMAEQLPKTPVVVLGTQPQSDLMAEQTSQWHSTYRRIGGGLFVKSCIEELGKDWNSIILSDFNLSPLSSISGKQDKLSLTPFNLANYYESSAFPGLALDLLSMPYRIEGASVSTGRQLFESISTNNHLSPFMSLHLGCPIHSDLLPRRPLDHPSFLERLWDLSVSPVGQPARITPDPHCDISSLTQYVVGRGLTHDQEISLVSQLKVSERRLCHPDPVPISLAFPQCEEKTEVASLSCLRSISRPEQSRLFVHLRDCAERALRLGKTATLESHGDIERVQLQDLSHHFEDLFHFGDTALDEDE